MDDWFLSYWLRSPKNREVLRVALAAGKPIKFLRAANDMPNPDFPIRPLGESDVRTIASRNGELLGAVIDTAPSFDVTGDQVASVLQNVLLDNVDMLRELVWRGSWLERPDVDRLDPDSLLGAGVAIIRQTRANHDEGRLERAIAEELRPYSAYLRGELA